MQQNQDVQPIEGLTQCNTCLNCPMFTDFRDSRSRGWCSAFERMAKTFHPLTHDCELAITQYTEQNPIEVAITLCTHELAIDPDDGHSYPKEERVISFAVTEVSRKAVLEAFEPHKDQFKGFYILDYHQCFPNAEF
ncbi:hypothetical protein [Cyanothece sp. BG0011]|uniref:hypothetical protein n=1 Tax=Cyanothece sp. BG0011 TaxID=2082950 RepID=UPI0018E52E22|nr:hypothetical protein [Cyanothece sp. BG0011]